MRPCLPKQEQEHPGAYYSVQYRTDQQLHPYRRCRGLGWPNHRLQPGDDDPVAHNRRVVAYRHGPAYRPVVVRHFLFGAFRIACLEPSCSPCQPNATQAPRSGTRFPGYVLGVASLRTGIQCPRLVPIQCRRRSSRFSDAVFRPWHLAEHALSWRICLSIQKMAKSTSHPPLLRTSDDTNGYTDLASAKILARHASLNPCSLK